MCGARPAAHRTDETTGRFNLGPEASITAPMRTGRPSRYKPAFVEQARLFCRLGADNEDLAALFSVSVATLYRWLERYPEFGLAAAIGRAQGAGLEKPGLYKRAIGYDFSARRAFRTRAGDLIAADVMCHVPADPAAALRWLQARQPGKWRPDGRPSAPCPTAAPDAARAPRQRKPRGGHAPD